MNLYSVTINHPRGGTRDLTISSDSKDLKAVEKMCTDAGLDVASVTRVAEEPKPAETPKAEPPKAEEPKPTGRIFGKSAEGPRRNKDEMEQDRAIEELAKELDIDLSDWEGEAATDIMAMLQARKAAADASGAAE